MRVMAFSICSGVPAVPTCLAAMCTAPVISRSAWWRDGGWPWSQGLLVPAAASACGWPAGVRAYVLRPPSAVEVSSPSSSSSCREGYTEPGLGLHAPPLACSSRRISSYPCVGPAISPASSSPRMSPRPTRPCRSPRMLTILTDISLRVPWSRAATARPEVRVRIVRVRMVRVRMVRVRGVCIPSGTRPGWIAAPVPFLTEDPCQTEENGSKMTPYFPRNTDLPSESGWWVARVAGWFKWGDWFGWGGQFGWGGRFGGLGGVSGSGGWGFGGLGLRVGWGGGVRGGGRWGGVGVGAGGLTYEMNGLLILSWAGSLGSPPPRPVRGC